MKKSNLPYYIYALINPVNQYPFYIGFTNAPDTRYEQHLKIERSSLKEQVVEYLEELNLKPLMIVLEKKRYRYQAKMAEKFWIKLFGERRIPIINKEIIHSSESASFHIKTDVEIKTSYTDTDIKRARARKRNKDTNLIKAKARAKRPTLIQNIDNGKPKNHGKSWESDEIQSLKKSFLAGIPIEEIAKKYHRSQVSIIFQLQRISGKHEKVYSRLAKLCLLKSQMAY